MENQIQGPVWPIVKRAFSDWTDESIGGKMVRVHKTVYVTYVRIEHDGVFYLQACTGTYVTKELPKLGNHEERAINLLNETAYLADRYSKIQDVEMVFPDGTKVYVKHDDQLPEKEFNEKRFHLI